MLTTTLGSVKLSMAIKPTLNFNVAKYKDLTPAQDIVLGISWSGLLSPSVSGKRLLFFLSDSLRHL